MQASSNAILREALLQRWEIIGPVAEDRVESHHLTPTRGIKVHKSSGWAGVIWLRATGPPACATTTNQIPPPTRPRLVAMIVAHHELDITPIASRECRRIFILCEIIYITGNEEAK
jgi:hypothetical protein